MRTRNARLAAIRSLFRFAALRHPEHAQSIERVLAIPPKRFQRNLVTFLSEEEVEALLAAPDRSTWTGRRDRAILMLAARQAAGIELTGLRCADLHLGRGPHVSCLGKGRKQRITPLTSATLAVLRVWLAERSGQAEEPLFPTRVGGRLSRDGLERRLAKHVASAATTCPSLREKKVTAHVLRHTAAMRLLGAGVDTSVIALWLGHEQVETTQIYLHANLAITRNGAGQDHSSRRQARPLPDAGRRPCLSRGARRSSTATSPRTARRCASHRSAHGSGPARRIQPASWVFREVPHLTTPRQCDSVPTVALGGWQG